ncbi:DNA-3-methyladenine glycosylase 2 [Stieleria maiorica]|uniref:DNA-3-methyladenine glycosylase 2 n=1 Tax=Stieleria maiorica TaxID=2795974 RepID=UPI0018F85F67|nr:DNA-3-methyladenine glycosylase 2 family protein [Stieleria maiorica]
MLKPKPPFRLDLAAWTIRRRPENVIDHWDGSVYRRVLPFKEEVALVEVTQRSSGMHPRLLIQVNCDNESPELRSVASAAVERLLGIRVDMQGFYEFAAGKPKLGPLASRFRGMKPPRFLTGFECLVNAIACQQFSLAAGIQILNRFSETFGRSFQSSDTGYFAFPRPKDLIQVHEEELREIGFSRQKAAALLDLARLERTGEFKLWQLQKVSDEAAVAELCRLHGVGRWTAEYALLRGLGRLHVFPGDDVGARNNLCRWLGLSEQLDYEKVARVLKRWKHFGGLIYFHLLLEKLAAGGHLATSADPVARDR